MYQVVTDSSEDYRDLVVAQYQIENNQEEGNQEVEVVHQVAVSEATIALETLKLYQE
jgi:hypothetical protein